MDPLRVERTPQESAWFHAQVIATNGSALDGHAGTDGISVRS